MAKRPTEWKRSHGVNSFIARTADRASPALRPREAPRRLLRIRIPCWLMSLYSTIGIGALRREKLRTARLYFVCDAEPHGEDPEARFAAALRGGVDMLQIREKQLERRVIERSARTARRLCDTYSVPFILNDDPELARYCGADGVHVGQDDVSPSEAREIMGPDAIIGLSTHSPEQVDASGAEPVDYISTGPIWETPTKEGRPPTGLGLIEYAAAAAPHPAFAIGGIDTGNIGEVVAAGARRIVVVRAIRDSDSPDEVAAALRSNFGAGAPPGA